MKKTRVLLAASIIAASLIFTGCASSQTSSQVSTETSSTVVSSDTSSTTSTASTAQKKFTVTELADYNGLNGKSAYIAVDGIVYDVTNVKEWANGTHQDYAAGLDLTKEIKAAPHGVAQLDGVPFVGTLN